MRQLSRLVSVVVALTIAGFLYFSWDEVARIELVAPAFLALCALGHLGNFLVTGAINYILLQRLGHKIPWTVTLHSGILTTFSNLILPFKGGLLARALYLRRKFDLGYLDFALTVVGAYVLIFLSASAIAILGLTTRSDLQQETYYLPVIATATAVFIGCLAAVAVPGAIGRLIKPIPKVGRVMEGWLAIRGQPRVLALLLVASLFEVVNTGIVLGAVYYALGVRPDLTVLAIIGAIACMAFFLSITPGGLGFFEGAIAVTAALAGIPIAVSVTAALVSRFVLLLVLLLCGPYSVYALERQVGAKAA